MRLIVRIHERLAERFPWVQYPKRDAYFPRESLWHRYQCLSRKEQGWAVFLAFWGSVFFIAFLANLFL